jgi:mannitol/fructose-specific phosphotransferase system IIA component (Ntr-type)
MIKVETEITKLLDPGTILVGLEGSTKADIIDAMISSLEGHADVVDLDQVRQDVLLREGIMSTGVGQGLGLPHAKTAGVGNTVAAFATTSAPIEYGSIDDRPVRLVFLLLGPETSRSQHIKILSRISRLMNRPQLREALLRATSAEEVIDALAEGELELLEG